MVRPTHNEIEIRTKTQNKWEKKIYLALELALVLTGSTRMQVSLYKTQGYYITFSLNDLSFSLGKD
jgi:hypothetical protein